MTARRLGAGLLGMALLLVAMGGGAVTAQTAQTVFRTITIGSYPSVAELVQAMAAQRMAASNRAVEILRTLPVSPAKAPLDLVVVSVGELGLKDHSKYADIAARARMRGLELCPAEAGPLLRMAYANQAEDDTLRVAMEPVLTGANRAPTVFMLSGKSLLAGDSDNPFDKNIRWVFVRR